MSYVWVATFAVVCLASVGLWCWLSLPESARERAADLVASLADRMFALRTAQRPGRDSQREEASPDRDRAPRSA